MKRSGAALIAASVLLGGVSAAVITPAAAAAAQTAANPVIHLSLNGTTLPQKALAGRDGSTLIPLAAVRDSLGLKVRYEAKTKNYLVTRGQTTVRLQPTEFQSVQPIVNGSTQFSYYEFKNIGGFNYISLHVLTDHLGYKASWNNTTKTADLTPLTLNAVSVKAQVMKKSDAFTNISIEYPVLQGLDNLSVQNAVNQMLKERAAQYASESLLQSAEFGLGPEQAKNEYDAYYTLEYNRNGYISFRMLNYNYTGGAHGMSYLEGITIRLSDGKQVQLSDLLTDHSDYLSVINTKVEQKLKQVPGYFGGFESVGDKPAFYLKEGGVVIFFQLYEYLPYAAGFPEYWIPFSELLPGGKGPLSN